MTTTKPQKNKKNIIITLITILSISIITAIIFIIMNNNIQENNKDNDSNKEENKKSYTTAIIDNKEYSNPNAVAIVNGVEVENLTELSSLTDKNMEAYVCLPQMSEYDKNIIPTLYWSNVNDVPKEYQTVNNSSIIINLPEPVEVSFDNSNDFMYYENYSYVCGFYGGIHNQVNEKINESIQGIWNETTQTYDIKPLPKEYDNWYGQQSVKLNIWNGGVSELTTKLSFTKWVQMERMTAMNENQIEYIKGFLNANSFSDYIFVNNQVISNPADATPTQIEEVLNKNIEEVSKVGYWDTLSPELKESYIKGFNAFFEFAKQPSDAVIMTLS